MKNNDIIRRLRYTFELSDSNMMELFELGGYPATRAEVSDWLKQEDDPAFKPLYDKQLAIFLNGMIAHERGRSKDDQPKPEKSLNNNIIFRKLKITLNLKDDEIVEILKLTGLSVSKHEINAFFRKPTQRQYRVCHDQYLRNFIYGLQLKYRGSDS
ncbi:MAG TPA: DUF1456 family protein [Bacteroidetes bacterium]|nr:DUF1456 family protein [Bacteroidota bacterium]